MKRTFIYATWMMLILYSALLAKLILFKGSPAHIYEHFAHHYSWGEIKRSFSRANFVPFHTIKLYLKSNLRAEYSFENLAGNILLFVPLGILVPLLFEKQRTFARVLMLSFFVSLLLEVIQLVAALGFFDVDDLILNTLGGAMGYLVLRVFYRK